MSSSRLPGKVLLPLGNKPVLQWVVDAARQAMYVDEVVVATSIADSDDPIVEHCDKHNINVWRGSLEDCLDRYYQVALAYQAHHVIRLTADCPLLDPGTINCVIREHLLGGHAYTCNFKNDCSDVRMVGASGTEVEVFTMNTLLATAKLAISPIDREHVTPFMRLNFGVGYCYIYGAPKEKLSIDTQEDYERIRRMVECSQNQKHS